MTRVKICGVNDAAAFDAVCEAGADWVGFVFYPRSPRFVSPAQAAALSGRRAGGPARVGLFVAAADEEIADTLAALPLDVLQLYDAPARVAEIAGRFGVPVWRACAVSGRTDLPLTCAPAAAALIEPRAPAGASRPGGNAQLLDWSVLDGWRPGFPWLLAGGLTPDNVAAAIAATGAPAVDVSSGVESAPGVKSVSLIARFVTSARAVDSST